MESKNVFRKFIIISFNRTGGLTDFKHKDIKVKITKDFIMHLYAYSSVRDYHGNMIANKKQKSGLCAQNILEG